MTDPAIEPMIANLPTRTGRPLDEWLGLLAGTGAARHGEIVELLKTEHGVTHGYANFIALRFLDGDAPASDDDLVAAQYPGAKAPMRPLYESLLAEAVALGSDVDVAPKKTYVALRRNKQFATIEPATRTRIDVGLNLKGEPATDRLRAVSGMCTHKVAVGDDADIDDELRGWLRRAYDRA